MKWIIALISLSVLSSCTTKPWMVGSVNDEHCGRKGMRKLKQPADIYPEEAPMDPYASGKSGKGYRSVMP
jgi:hypothetical protein